MSVFIMRRHTEAQTECGSRTLRWNGGTGAISYDAEINCRRSTLPLAFRMKFSGSKNYDV